jgi:hypothetical protein
MNTFRVFETGGSWKYSMHGPVGKDYRNEFPLVEIIPKPFHAHQACAARCFMGVSV